MLVSTGIESDVLIATISNASMFSSAETGIEIDPNFFMTKVLPKMLPRSELAVVMEAVAVVVEKGVQIGLIS